MMNRIFLLIILFSFYLPLSAQHEVLTDRNGKKMLKGIIVRNNLSEDSAFAGWYARNLQNYIPDSAAVQAMKERKSIEFIVFMGTWCGDSQVVIPKFYKLLEAAEYPEENVTLLATDRFKKTVAHLAEAFAIKYVPTIIVMENGREIGRVIEYGESGKFDKELGQLLGK